MQSHALEEYLIEWMSIEILHFFLHGPILLEETKEMSQVSHTPSDQTYFFAQKYTSTIEAVSINFNKGYLKDIFL